MASSVALITAKGSVILLDASPDIRQQSVALMTSDRYPSGRDAPFDAIALTHGHMGHYAGLLHLGKESSDLRGVKLLATGRMHSFLRANDPWRALYERRNLVPDTFGLGAIRVDEEVTIDAITVPHRAEYTDTVAISVRVDGEPWLMYLPDIDGWGDWRGAEEAIASHQICLLDATFSDPGELPGRDVAAIRHPLVGDTLDRFGHLASSTHIILGHINHSNALADPTSDIATTAKDAGFTVAFDGLHIST